MLNTSFPIKYISDLFFYTSCKFSSQDEFMLKSTTNNCCYIFISHYTFTIYLKDCYLKREQIRRTENYEIREFLMPSLSLLWSFGCWRLVCIPACLNLSIWTFSFLFPYSLLQQSPPPLKHVNVIDMIYY